MDHVVNISEISEAQLKQLLEEIKTDGYEIFHSEGLFIARARRSNEIGHSLVVLQHKSQEFVYHKYWPQILIDTAATHGGLYLRDHNDVPKGNRRAEFIFAPSPTDTAYDMLLVRHRDYQEYLRAQGNLFTYSQVENNQPSPDGVLVIVEADGRLIGHTSDVAKTYLEV